MPVQNQPQSSTEITNDSIIHSIPTITNTKPQNPKMPVQDQPQSSTEITNDSIIHSIINANVNATLSPLSTTKIPRVPDLLKETHDYEKYFVPKVVSIGPYHHGNKKLEFVEKLKPAYTMKLLKDNKETLRRLYEKLGEPKRVENLRSFYEEKWTTMYCDKLFTKMMLLDSCFILYYIQYIFSDNPEYCGELKSHQIAFVHRDLFLLENQIPLEVLREVMEIIKNDCMGKIILFIEGTILAPKRPERGWLDSLLCIRNNQSGRNESDQKELMYMESNHLLHLLHRSLTKTSQASRRRCRNSCSQWQVQCVEDIRNTCSSCSQWLVRWVENTRNSCSQWLVWRWVENIRFSCTKVEQRSVQTRRVPDYESSLGLSPQKKSGRRESKYNDKRYTFRNVLELVDVGIHFKPSDSKSLAHIKFSKGW
ncbi:hypothetical protein HanOQP8_Chr13g0471021 [Helianthus annuus]|nr:hypothetical protein HanOQP8_Chr13g0471021 [Helianthus annuus]